MLTYDVSNDAGQQEALLVLVGAFLSQGQIYTRVLNITRYLQTMTRPGSREMCLPGS